MVLSPGGELGAGYVDRSIHSSARPQPGEKSGMILRKYPDGLQCSYDTESHSLTLTRPEELNVVVKGTYIEFQTEKAAIKNKAGTSLFGEIARAFRSIFKSKTATMMGPQALLPAATELPQLLKNIDSFGEGDAT
jgi:phage baseplate assembly protein gpV